MTDPPPHAPRTLSIPTRTLPLLALLLCIGSVVLAFTFLTIHRFDTNEMRANPAFDRMHFSITYWLDHGYFRSGGILVRPDATPPGYFFYRSSTGVHLFSVFVLEKLTRAITGHVSLRLLAVHNLVVALLVSAALGLLAFRLAIRIGTRPLHALTLAATVEIVHFTFPDIQAMYWELTGRPWFLFFAAVFLLIEERRVDGGTRRLNVAQSVVAFLLTYMEYGAGISFLMSYAIVSTLATPNRITIRRLLAVTILPAAIAMALFAAQLTWVRTQYPDVPKGGSTFLFRSGLDGSTEYYGDHLDIAYGRNAARATFPHAGDQLFRWPSRFFAGAAAVVSILLLAICGRVPHIALVAMVSLLGAYVVYAAVFSQAFVIHPYLFDILLFAPLTLALFGIAPSLFESMSGHRGVIVVTVLFLAIWVTMVQLRHYAVQYPSAVVMKK